MSQAHFIGNWELVDGDAPGDFILIPTQTGFGFERANGERIIVDRPFVTDGASVPRCFRWTVWLDPFGTFREAAFIHDYLWVLRYTGEEIRTFGQSNAILREAAIVAGLRTWQAWLVWLAVTLGGWPWWVMGWRQRRIAKQCVEAAQTLGGWR